MWMAGSQRPAGDSFFVDAYTQEFSRDIEPMKGGHTDNYFYQMVSLIREFKGARPLPAASDPKTIQIDGQFADWTDVAPEYRDTLSDQANRNEENWNPALPHYINTTGRNDLMVQKVAQNGNNIYFYAKTKQALTTYSGLNWMLLYLDADNNAATGWQGYDYLINRQIGDSEKTSLEKWTLAGWELVDNQIRWRTSGQELEVVVPRTLLGFAGLAANRVMNFKWADNVQDLSNILEFTLNGDAAPNDRFMYQYQILPLESEPSATVGNWRLY
jgi:hypothetical protein